MKQFNDLARKVSDFHQKGKGLPKSPENPADPESDIPSSEPHSDMSKTPDEMHSELSSMICPDCHKHVKAMMVKHGLMKNPNESDEEGHSAPSAKHELSNSLK